MQVDTNFLGYFSLVISCNEWTSVFFHIYTILGISFSSSDSYLNLLFCAWMTLLFLLSCSKSFYLSNFHTYLFLNSIFISTFIPSSSSRAKVTEICADAKLTHSTYPYSTFFMPPLSAPPPPASSALPLLTSLFALIFLSCPPCVLSSFISFSLHVRLFFSLLISFFSPTSIFLIPPPPACTF